MGGGGEGEKRETETDRHRDTHTEGIALWNQSIVLLKRNVSISKLSFLVPNVIIQDTGRLDY